MSSFVIALWAIHGVAVVFVMWALHVAYPRPPQRNPFLYWLILFICGVAWWLVFIWSLCLIFKDFRSKPEP